ncbi:MAG: hypothetical protein NTV34_07065 [Proteobacteria bacterium]|nr:hypothetical protein [Pseudomonadota bacterium]
MILSSLGFSAFADDDQRLYQSAYYIGRGNTGIAIADDQEAIIYNPAGIAQGKGIYKRTILLSPMVEFSDDARNLVRELGEDSSDTTAILKKRVGKNEHVGAYNLTAIVFRRAAIGVLAGATTDILVYKSPDAGGLESVDAKLRETIGPTFTLAESFWNDHLLIGGTFKYLQRGQAQFNANITDSNKLKTLKQSDLFGVGMGASTDFGVMLKGSGRLEPAFGITTHNLGGTKFTPTTETAPTPDPLKQVIDIGVAVQPGTKVSRFRLLGEYWDATNAHSTSIYKKIHLGGEISIRDAVGFTCGTAQGWSSGGVYIDLYLLRLDAGMYIQEMSDRAGVRPDKRMFLRLALGF